MRAGRRFGMILHAVGRQLAMPHAFDRLVVQVAVRHLQTIGQIVLAHGKSVVLRRDFHATGLKVLHRLVGATVAELQLERRGPTGQAQQLVAQADAEKGCLAQQLADRVDGIDQGLRIARAIRQEDPVGLEGQDLGVRSRPRHDRYPGPLVAQVPGNVPFHAVVNRHDVWRFAGPGSVRFGRRIEFRPGAEPLVPRAGLFGHHLAHQVAPHQARAGLGLLDQTGVVEIFGRKHSLERPVLANPADQRSGINARNAHHAVLPQVFFQCSAGAKVTGHAAAITNHETGQLRPGAFDVLVVDAVIADLGIGHRHDLATVARIGEDFLIPGHRRVKTHFAVDFPRGSKRMPRIDRSILQGQLGNFHVCNRSSYARVRVRQTLRLVMIARSGAAASAKVLCAAGPIRLLRLWVSGRGHAKSGQPNQRVLAPASKSPLFLRACWFASPRAAQISAIISPRSADG